MPGWDIGFGAASWNRVETCLASIRQYHKWFSDNLGPDMELLVFGYAGAKVLVFPTRKGRFFRLRKLGNGQCTSCRG